MITIVIGDVDTEHALKEIKKDFKTEPRKLTKSKKRTRHIFRRPRRRCGGVLGRDRLRERKRKRLSRKSHCRRFGGGVAKRHFLIHKRCRNLCSERCCFDDKKQRNKLGAQGVHGYCNASVAKRNANRAGVNGVRGETNVNDRNRNDNDSGAALFHRYIRQ